MLTTAFNVGTAHPAFSLLRTVTHENRSLFETLNERVLTLSRLRHRPVSALECLEETEWTPDPFPLLPRLARLSVALCLDVLWQLYLRESAFVRNHPGLAFTPLQPRYDEESCECLLKGTELLTLTAALQEGDPLRLYLKANSHKLFSLIRGPLGMELHVVRRYRRLKALMDCVRQDMPAVLPSESTKGHLCALPCAA